jgi:p-hydroxybenzoate 3-monooxygenase
MLHSNNAPFDAKLQLAQLRWVASSGAGVTGLAENCASVPIGYQYAGR